MKTTQHSHKDQNDKTIQNEERSEDVKEVKKNYVNEIE
jgi:hypothetical protein